MVYFTVCYCMYNPYVFIVVKAEVKAHTQDITARTQNRLKAEGFFRMNKDKEINLKTGILHEKSFMPYINCKKTRF